MFLSKPMSRLAEAGTKQSRSLQGRDIMKMLIGLTGKTGSGKSTAAEIFKKLGAFVADCDKIAHSTLEDDAVKAKLLREFSEGIFNSDGTINRKKLGEIVFSNEEKLSALNCIMHKAIVDSAIAMCISSGKDICFLDGSEIESSGAYKKCACVVVITADEDIRLHRIMERDGIDRESALMRILSQKDYGQKAIFVENNGDRDALEKKITRLYNQFSGELNA